MLCQKILWDHMPGKHTDILGSYPFLSFIILFFLWSYGLIISFCWSLAELVSFAFFQKVLWKTNFNIITLYVIVMLFSEFNKKKKYLSLWWYIHNICLSVLVMTCTSSRSVRMYAINVSAWIILVFKFYIGIEW